MMLLVLYAAGGLTAVIWTDFIQTIIMLVGASYLMIQSESVQRAYVSLSVRLSVCLIPENLLAK